MKLLAPCLIIMLASSSLFAAETLWRVVDRFDIERVPSAFPVGFSLLTHDRRQYAAYYDANHQMTVAARGLDERTWRLVKLDSRVGWDSHNGITMAVDAEGCIHLAGNMHGGPLVYFRMEKPGDAGTFKRLPMTGRNEGRCTYPHFLYDKAGRLLFNYRDGGSGNGRRFWNVYDVKGRSWSRLMNVPMFEGQGKRNAYPSGPTLGPDNRYHVIWVWRDTPDCATNHDLSYARSSDLVHWETAGGEPIELPMMLGTKGLIVDPAAPGSGMINGGQKLAFDSGGHPMIAYHKSDANGNMQVYVARFDEGKWRRRAITSWDKPVKFSGRGAMPFIGIRISAPQPVGDGVWQVSYRHRDYGSGAVAFKEATLEPAKAGPVAEPRSQLPAELGKPEISFAGIGVRQSGDRGESGDDDVRYMLVWETLGANHDRKPAGPHPPASMLRLYKLSRSAQ